MADDQTTDLSALWDFSKFRGKENFEFGFDFVFFSDSSIFLAI